MPGTLALKAAAQAALSTNIFGGVAGAATSTAISNTNAALVADVVEKVLVAETMEIVLAKEGIKSKKKYSAYCIT